jgi:hypothetical protein
MEESSVKQIFDAQTGSSIDGCDPDWCAEVMYNASSRDVQRVSEALSSSGTDSEAARKLGVMD